MSDRTSIEWTDSTWSPVTGCTRVSSGCANCYIERQTPMRIAGRRFRQVGNQSTTGVILHPERLERIPKGPKIFVCSMSDLFHEDVPDEYLGQIFDAIAAHPDRIFQVLTKRPERAHTFLQAGRQATADEVDEGYELGFVPPYYYDGQASFGGGIAAPLPNLWLGVSVENARFTWRAEVLRKIPAAVRFISAEPLLGSLFEWHAPVGSARPGHQHKRALNLSGIDWLIAGGESGPGYRPMQIEHARELREACLERDVAFFFKQHGGPTPKSGGKELDGRQWCQMPGQAVAA